MSGTPKPEHADEWASRMEAANEHYNQTGEHGPLNDLERERQAEMLTRKEDQRINDLVRNGSWISGGKSDAITDLARSIEKVRAELEVEVYPRFAKIEERVEEIDNACAIGEDIDAMRLDMHKLVRDEAQARTNLNEKFISHCNGQIGEIDRVEKWRDDFDDRLEALFNVFKEHNHTSDLSDIVNPIVADIQELRTHYNEHLMLNQRDRDRLDHFSHIANENVANQRQQGWLIIGAIALAAFALGRKS